MGGNLSLPSRFRNSPSPLSPIGWSSIPRPGSQAPRHPRSLKRSSERSECPVDSTRPGRMKRLFFRNYWMASSLRHWFARRFTKSGLLVVSGLFLTLGLAFDTEQSLAYQTFALLLCLSVVSLLTAVFFRGRFKVKRP